MPRRAIWRHPNVSRCYPEGARYKGKGGGTIADVGRGRVESGSGTMGSWEVAFKLLISHMAPLGIWWRRFLLNFKIYQSPKERPQTIQEIDDAYRLTFPILCSLTPRVIAYPPPPDLPRLASIVSGSGTVSCVPANALLDIYLIPDSSFGNRQYEMGLLVPILRGCPER